MDVASVTPSAESGAAAHRPAVVIASWLAPFVVWVVWAAAAVIGAWWVIWHGRRFPYSDDWYLVDVLVGNQPMTGEWLWSLYDVHRLVVPRLAMIWLTRLGNGDWRTATLVNLVLLSGTAAAAILVLRRVRGRTELTDVFMPLLMVSLTVPGLSFGFQIHFTTTALAAVGVLLVMLRYGMTAPPRALWLSAGMLLILLGEGGPGLSLMPALLVWLMMAGGVLRRTRRSQGTLIMASVVLLIAGMGAYFIDFHSYSTMNARTLRQLVVALGHVASTPGGDRSSDLWPWSGIFFALVILGTAALALRALRGPKGPERQQAFAFVLFGSAVATLLLAIAYGRGGMPWIRGLEHHYIVLSLPLCCWLYVVWARFGGKVRTCAATGLAGLVFLTYSWSIYDARAFGPYLTEKTDAFESDLCAGMAPSDLAFKHNYLLYYSDITTDSTGRNAVIAGIGILREHHYGPFGC
jgi:hypothetical protein